MKKIGIITLHNNCNFGAVLQTYATQKKLCELGHDAKIINYVNPYGKDEAKLFSKSLKNNLRTLSMLRGKALRIKKFKGFMSERYRLSGKAICDYNDLNENMFDYDIYLTGSDQTFNLFLKGDIEVRKQYFLPFVKKSKKISYASSMGEKIQNVTDDGRSFMKDALSSYDKVLVREEKTADFIENELNLPRPTVVLDPTLLIKPEKWDELSKPIKYEKDSYILFYSVLSAPWVIKYVEETAKKLGLKVIAPHLKNRFEMSSDIIHYIDCGPEEFISLIKNASAVLTTSFHATAFSIIYNKPFYSLVMGEGNRIKTLLSSTGLEERAVFENDQKPFDINISFDKANEKLEQLVEKSTNALVDAIGE